MSYLEDFEKTLAEKCHQNEPPFCQAACPFRLDIKGLEEKWKKGRFNAAYRTYQNTVGFPDIVSKLCSHPCEKACLRAKLDGGIAIGLLERATVEYAKRKAPNAYNLPSKGKKIAIVGGGLSGLGCALRLCNKKYEVTVYEREMVLGGQARNQMDPAEFDAEIEAQFQFEEFSRHLGETVTDLETLRADYDAVYVATGADGADFGLEMDPDGAFATRTPGVFIGGSLTGGDSMKALADGLAVSLAIERYLKTGGMNEPFRKEGTLLNLQTNGIERADRVVPANGESYTEEEAMQEITRCQKCSCDACMRACDLMRLHEKTPRRLYEEVYITIHPGTLSRDGTWATRLISTCDHCGLCKEVCPQHIDFSQFLLDSMRAMQKKGAMPWPFHDFWLRDMAYASGKAGLTRKPENVKKSSYAFFPGCQLAGSDPRYVTRTYEWLRSKKPDAAIWMTCCGAPAEWAGEVDIHAAHLEEMRRQWRELGEPTVVLACPNCRKMFEEYLPELPVVFLAEVMEEIGMIEREVDTDLFSSVVHHIIGQQISTKAQETIWRRMKDDLGVIDAETILEAGIPKLQAYGMTFRKAEYLTDFAEKIRSGAFDLDAVWQMSDQEAIEALSSLNGIGVWTAEMILLFCMQRPDVFSYGDLAILRGLRMVYHHRKIDKKLFEKYRRRFSPYCSVASLYLWAVSGGAIPGMKDYAPKTIKSKTAEKKVK